MAISEPKNIVLQNGSTVTIRSYNAGDVESFRTFVRKTAAETTHTLKYEGMEIPSAELLLQRWKNLETDPIAMDLGVFAGTNVIGNLRFFQRNPHHPWTKHMGSFGMAVSREFWGHRIGTQLLVNMETHARSVAIKRIEAEVRAENPAGITLYTKFGFKIEGTREKCALINGLFVDEYYIAKLYA
jgi:putative acetyltransferase